MTGLARIALLVRIFRRSRQTVRAARAGMWSNPGCESLFHPYVGVMFMPAGGRNHVRHRGGRQLRCRRIRQTFQDNGVFQAMKDFRKHGDSHHPGQHPQSQHGYGGERPMFANDPRDYPRAGQRHGHADEPYYDAGQSWQQQGQHAAQPGQGQQAAHGQPQGAQPGQAAPQGQEGWQTAGQEAPLHAEAGQDDAVVAALQAEIEALKAQLAEAEQKAGENHEHFVRASAETENVRRRSKEELDKARKFAIEGFAESLLPVCDSLEMALTVESPSVDSIREGVQATLRQLQQALERNKVQVIDPLGQRFDPNTQQAISMQPNPEVAANHVAAVLQKGYLINDRVLRPAMVVVSQG